MQINFFDTSAILNGALKTHSGNTYLSCFSLKQLENIKTASYKDDNVKFKARKVIKQLIHLNCGNITAFPARKINSILKKYNFLEDINDHKILCEAVLTSKENNQIVNFITSDGAQYLIGNKIPELHCIFFNGINESNQDQYCGWGRYYPTESQMNLLYSDPKMNILKCKINEYAEIYQGTELKDILRWDGVQYQPIKYKEIKNKFLNETIKPLNLQQKMAFDLLQNSSIPVKLLPGAVGTGKDYLMLTHALDLVQRGAMNKIIFIRNLVPFKDAPEIGYLAGNLQQKIAWGMGPLASILGEEGLNEMEELGIIEAVNLGFIRGMSWDKTIIYVSEGQNITGGGYKLLVSRCGEGSQLWVNGDILQTDAKRFQENNGINRLINSLSGDQLFGMVKLIKTQRSKTAELASKI